MARDKAERSAAFNAGFDFARRLRDPEFRALLERHGWRRGQRVVIAVDDEPVVDVIARMMLHETESRSFIAILDAREKHGFRFLIVEVVDAGQETPDPIELGAGASIGMLYSALEPCGAYVPSAWTGPLLFERIEQRAAV
jgi:hypothetical protein